MAFTVVPLHNLKLASGTRADFGSQFVFEDIPEWLGRDPHLNRLSEHDRDSLLLVKHALVAEYEANAIGEDDPKWNGVEPRSIQEAKYEAAVTANIALWLARPTPVCFTLVFHALSFTYGGHVVQPTTILRSERSGPIHCHPDDEANSLTQETIVQAGTLHATIVGLQRRNAVWEAMRAVWAGLKSYTEDRRYPFFWIALESLFGPDQQSLGITKRLARRISRFLCSNQKTANQMYDAVLQCYNVRSEIVHGRWDQNPRTTPCVAQTEGIVRSVFLRLLNDPNLLAIFLSSGRDQFLEDLTFPPRT
jgi:hypothetical protein